MMGCHEVQKSALGVSVGDHDPRSNLVPIVEDNSSCTAIADADLLHYCPSAQACPMGFGSTCQGLRQGTHTAAHEAPQTADTGRTPHTVMQEHIGCAGHGWTTMRADHSIGGQGGLDRVRFKTLVEKLLHTLREQLEQHTQVPIV